MKKDIPKQKKGETTRLLLLNHWVQIIDCLYPNRKVENPYEDYLLKLAEPLAIMDRILLLKIIRSITLINTSSRENDQGELLSAKTDVMNGLRLVLPKAYQLTYKHMKNVEDLRKVFKESPFTYVECGGVLKRSIRTSQRILDVLKQYGLVEQLAENRNQSSLFKLKDCSLLNDLIEESVEEKPSIFTEMSSEWEDFTGYQDLQNRT